jgi:fatty-acyl-CoA synthase
MSATDSGKSSLKAWVRALELTAPIARNRGLTLPVRIDDLADEFGAAPALMSDRESVSYRQLSEQSNRYARWALDQGLAAGDVVCLVMPNCPEYMAIWLGLTRTGAIVSLVNTSLVGDSLAHALRVAAPRHVIVAAALAGAVAEVATRLGPTVTYWAHGADGHGFPRIDDAIRTMSAERVTESERARPSIADRALYIYTSGTTGLPKAAIVTHERVLQWCYWFAGLLDAEPLDRMYNCLPMYHSIGGVVAPGAMLVKGGSVVIRERFSARDFWDDVVDRECTLFQYIGELCRFLVNAPPHPREQAHKLRLCCGNGLRPDVWPEFQRRFRIPAILEFYAATEANFSLYNCEGKPGAIGRIPSFLAHRFPVALVRFDPATGEPTRDAEGFCIRCATDEPGEAIAKINGDGSSEGGRFDGYTDAGATDRKVLRDAFARGDAWFRTGDLMRRDRAGFFYFIDRLGDTFRWKGENVSTTEVAEAVSSFPGIQQAIVYGVAVAGTEGRAGMAAIVADERFDLSALDAHLATCLPEYARPVFLRVLNEIEMTDTFKQKKQDLVRAGFDPRGTSDALYFNTRGAQGFVRLDDGMFGRIESGSVRL